MICNLVDPMSLRHPVVGEREQTHARAHNPVCECVCVYVCWICVYTYICMYNMILTITHTHMHTRAHTWQAISIGGDAMDGDASGKFHKWTEPTSTWKLPPCEHLCTHPLWKYVKGTLFCVNKTLFCVTEPTSMWKLPPCEHLCKHPLWKYVKRTLFCVNKVVSHVRRAILCVKKRHHEKTCAKHPLWTYVKRTLFCVKRDRSHVRRAIFCVGKSPRVKTCAKHPLWKYVETSVSGAMPCEKKPVLCKKRPFHVKRAIFCVKTALLWKQVRTSVVKTCENIRVGGDVKWIKACIWKEA